MHDCWLVVGQSIEEEDRLRVQRTWLLGRETRREALILQFAHASQTLETSLMPGSSLDADLAFYPSAFPLRALIKTRHASPQRFSDIPGYPTILSATGAYAAALSKQPWLERFPMLLQNTVPQRVNEHWIVRDSADTILPLSQREGEWWTLLALSGGHPVTLFGIWDGDLLTPLSLFIAGQFIGV